MKITTVFHDYSMLTHCLRILSEILSGGDDPEVDMDGSIVIRNGDGFVIGWAEIDDEDE